MEPTSHTTKKLAKKLQTAADTTRLNILCYIFGAKKACVSDIADALGLGVAITSHHLKSLSKEGMLDSKREGKNVSYVLSKTPFMTDLRKFICKYK